MTRYVITPDIALYLAHHVAQQGGSVPREHQLLAPTLLRSQVLSELYARVAAGELERSDADRQLDCIRGLRLRLLGDRVLQRRAWQVAERLHWPDTYQAEYVALTQLQADALITLDAELALAVRESVPLEPITVLLPHVR